MSVQPPKTNEHKRISRGSYASWGVGLSLLKYNIDRIVSSAVFDRRWYPSSYLPSHSSGRLSEIDQQFYATILLLSVPFIFVGVFLTIRRLRDAALPLSLVGLFFLPFLNLLFFAFLSIVPSREASEISLQRSELFDRIIPKSQLGSAAFGCFVTSVLGTILTILSIYVLGTYGWGLFVGIPFMTAVCSVLIYGYHNERSLAESVGVSFLSIVLLGAVLMGFAIEGFLCLIMALPVAAFIGLLGGFVGYIILTSASSVAVTRASMQCFAFALPLLMLGETLLGGPAERFVVKSTIRIAAKPETVWRHVISFSELPQPTDWLFKTGIAYPVRARIDGEGVGAIRHCEFSTGAFVEPIEVWDPPKRLRFSVTKNPPPMEEWSLYASVTPPHQHGFLQSEQGQFLITPLDDGSLQLEGTTWYRHHMWPAAYWRLFSDQIISRIHMRVLRHIKQLAEKSENAKLVEINSDL